MDTSRKPLSRSWNAGNLKIYYKLLVKAIVFFLFGLVCLGIVQFLVFRASTPASFFISRSSGLGTLDPFILETRIRHL